MASATRVCAAFVWFAFALAASGCLQIETRIRLNDDGSGTVTERVRYSRELLDTDVGRGDGTTFASLLTKDVAGQRAKEMGKDVSLASFDVRDAERAAKESVAVYQVKDLTDFVYPCAFFGWSVPECNMRIRLVPHFEYDWHGWWPGCISVQLVAAPALKAEPKKEPGDPPKKAELPAGPIGRQAYRDVAPVFREMLNGFQLKVIFENYGRIRVWDGRRHGYTTPNEAVIIDYRYSSEGASRNGTEVLDNEEALVDMLRIYLQPEKNHPRFSPFIGGSVKWSSGGIIQPSRPLFKRYFEGKMLNFDRPEHKDGTRLADFNEIGERGAADVRQPKK